MSYRIVLLDLDGTLLNNQKKVNPRDKAALWDLHKRGVKIGYLTSRTERKLQSLIEGLPCDFVGSVNGAMLRFYDNGHLLWSQTAGIAWHKGLQILKACESVKRKHLSAIFSPYQYWDGNIRHSIEGGGLQSIGLESITPVRFQRIRLYEPKSLPDIDLSSYRIAEEGADILIESRQVDKGSAAQDVLSYFGIAPEEAVCFGDEEVDISMFGVCGTSVAPSNANSKVLNAATEITCDNDHACIAHWLEANTTATVRPHLQGSISESDCCYLLKDVNGMLMPMPASRKKEILRKGLPIYSVLAEDPPITNEENNLFLDILDQNASSIAASVGILAESILSHKGNFPVLVSLVRGGVVYGSLCRRYYQKYYHMDVPHYAISLIRGYGIDQNALNYIVQCHGDQAIQFIDGWTGSGFLCSELRKYINIFNQQHGTQIDPELGVLADTSGVCLLSGTREDIMLPDCCLNATVCGLISSVCIASEVVGPDDYHGAVVWNALSAADFSNYYLNTISNLFSKQQPKHETIRSNVANLISRELVSVFQLSDQKKARLGIGESTRAMFRSEISYLLVKDYADPRLRFLCKMAEERNVSIRAYPLKNYSCAALLK